MTPQGGIHAFLRRVQPRAPPRQHGTLINDEDVVLNHHSEESGSGSTHAATDACSYGFHLTPRRCVANSATGGSVENTVGLDVDLRTSQFGREAGVLTFLADRQ